MGIFIVPEVRSYSSSIIFAWDAVKLICGLAIFRQESFLIVYYHRLDVLPDHILGRCSMC